MKLRIAVTGHDAVASALANRGSSVVAGLKQLIEKVGDLVRDNAQANAPVNTGELKGSIEKETISNGLGVNVEAKSDHAIFVELGTGARGAGSLHPPLPAGYSHGSRPGMPAQPYLYPAFRTAEDTFEGDVQDVANREWAG